jgi:metal-dependent hydrolase (beta-lactamase superfamily II)
MSKGGDLMLLRCAKTSSEGNAFAIETDNEILLLEAGVDVKTIKKMIDFKVGKVSGLIVSHGHT